MLHDSKAAADTHAPIAVRIKDAYKMVGISRSKLYELIASGDVEDPKIERISLIPVGVANPAENDDARQLSAPSK